MLRRLKPFLRWENISRVPLPRDRSNLHKVHGAQQEKLHADKVLPPSATPLPSAHQNVAPRNSRTLPRRADRAVLRRSPRGPPSPDARAAPRKRKTHPYRCGEWSPKNPPRWGPAHHASRENGLASALLSRATVRLYDRNVGKFR